ncbi:MAG: hypothetical protein E7597_05095 [Ruminococcaceae bacterium]|nr:hypothetical protein [Oscillospiraceae bacterium]
MMRRTVCLLTALCFLLCACGGKEDKAAQSFTLDQDTYNTLSAAVEGFNSQDLRQTAVIIGLTQGDESRYFNQGTYAYSRKEPVAMSGKSTEVYGGDGISVDVYYKAGAYYYSGKAGKFYESFDKEQFLKQYLCTNISLPAENKVSGLRTAQTSAGTKYVLTAVDEDVFNALFGDILLTYSGVKKPQRDKTKYTDGSFTCVLDGEGKLAALSISCKVSLYDSPAYYPTGYVPTEAELCHSFELSYELNVKATGKDVEIESPTTKDFTFLG